MFRPYLSPILVGVMGPALAMADLARTGISAPKPALDTPESKSPVSDLEIHDLVSTINAGSAPVEEIIRRLQESGISGSVTFVRSPREYEELLKQFEQCDVFLNEADSQFQDEMFYGGTRAGGKSALGDWIKELEKNSPSIKQSHFVDDNEAKAFWRFFWRLMRNKERAPRSRRHGERRGVYRKRLKPRP